MRRDRSADSGRRRLQPALRPIGDRVEHWLERAPARCQSIAHSHRRTRIHEALDDSLGLELTQSLSEHSITDARDARQQLIEASRCGNQSLDNCPGPALTD